ncbi:MAG: hypothetical protein NXI04_07585 [Planctomycetaceae bacterium]|nr:hypothetical protein [Planctomycetaceae bacterium]
MPESSQNEPAAIRLLVFDRIIDGYDRELQQIKLQIERRKKEQNRQPLCPDYRIRRAA